MATLENVLQVTQRSGAEYESTEVSGWARFVPAGLITLAFLPILILHGHELWARPHYQFFPLVIPGAAALIWKWCGRLGRLEPGSRSLGYGTAMLSWVMLGSGVAFISPGIGALAALVALLSAAYSIGGRRLAVAAFPAWGLLWLAIPPPKHFDVVLIVKLQNLVSRWSSQLLDLIGVYHVMDGNVVDVGGAPLLVDQACSGVYSLITLLIGTLFYALWVRTSPARTAILLGASIVWVVFGNLLRIILVVVLTTRWNIDAASGWRHEALGLITFVLMLVLVLSTDRLLNFAQAGIRMFWQAGQDIVRQQNLSKNSPVKKNMGALDLSLRSGSRLRRSAEGLGREGKVPLPMAAAAPLEALKKPITDAASIPKTPAPDLGPTQLPDLRHSWVGSWGFAAAFVILFVPQLMMPGAHWKEVLLAKDVYQEVFKDIDGKSLPPQDGPFQFVKFDESDRSKDSSWGEHSKSWFYNAGPASVSVVSLDYEFVDWHELTLCYKAQGWSMIKRTVLTPPNPLPNETGKSYGPIVAAWFANLEGRHKYLLFGLYDRKGRAIEPDDTRSLATDFRLRLRSWIRTGDAGGSEADVLCHQLQTFVDSDKPLSERETQQALELHASARSRIDSLTLKSSTKEGGTK